MFTRSEKILLALLAGIQFNHIVDFMIMMPLGPQVMRQLDMTPAQFGFVISAYTFAAGIMSFLGAFFLDKFDRRRALIFLSIGFAVGTLSCSLAPNFFFLLIARASAGAFGGIMGSTVLAIVGDGIPPERRGRAMGIVMAAFSAASVLGVPFSLFLANHFSWHAPFIFLGSTAFFMTIAITVALPSMTGHIGRQMVSPVKVVGQILATRETSTRLLFMMFLIFGQFVVIPFLSPSLVANNGLPESQLTLIYLCGGALTIFSNPTWGRYSDRFGYRRVALLGITVSILPILLVTHMPVLPVPVLLAAVSLFMVCISGRMVPAMTMMTSTVPPEKRGSFMSLTSCVQQLTAGAAASTAGYIIVKDAEGHLLHFGTVGWIAVASSTAAFLLLYRMNSAPPTAPAAR